jgi:hypothetical protein
MKLNNKKEIRSSKKRRPTHQNLKNRLVLLVLTRMRMMEEKAAVCANEATREKNQNRYIFVTQNANESRNIFQLCVMALFTFCMLSLLCNERKNVVCSSENMKRWMRDGSRQWWPHPREEVLMSYEGSSRRKSSAHKCRNDPSIWEDCGNIIERGKKEEKRCRRWDKFTLIILLYIIRTQ